LAKLESLIKANISNLSMDSLTNSAYYFCKFQYGDREFWESVEG